MAIVLLVGIVRVGLSFPGASVPLDRWLNRHGPDTPGYPCAAATFVGASVRPKSGRLLNEFNWGGYLGWRLGDRFQILMDGRTQLFSAEFWRATYERDRVNLSALNASAANADAAIFRGTAG